MWKSEHIAAFDYACWDTITFTGLQYQQVKIVSKNAIMQL